MGFLRKKSMLIPLLALSLAACAPKPTVTGPLIIDLPCDGDVKDYTIDGHPMVIFQTSGCDLTDVNFTNDVGKTHFKNKKNSPATSIKIDYDGGAWATARVTTTRHPTSPRAVRKMAAAAESSSNC